MNFHHTAVGLLSYALQSGLLLVVGLLLPRVLRLRHPKTLLVYWRVLLIVVLFLPLAATIWQPEAPLPRLAIESLTVETVVSTTLPQGMPGITWRGVSLAVATVAVLALLRLLIGLVYLNRCRRTAVALAPTPTPVTHIQQRLGLKIPFLVSDRLSVPLTFGWLRPAIIVPTSFHDLTEDQQEGVACHELIHVRRRDWPMTVFEEIVRAVLWFHPAVWVLLSKIALSREQVVDARAVRLTGKRRPYLDALWHIVCTYQRHANALAVPLIGRRHLVERVAWLKKEISMSKTRIAISVIILAAVVAATGVVGASVFPSASESALDVQPMVSPNSPAKTDLDGDDENLKTTSKDAECDEITHPVVIEKDNPKYPEEARKEKVMGVVTLETVINENGTVDEIEVLRSPDERLSKAAVEAVRQWTFEPALCDGRPVGVYYNLTIKFNLK
jgi:TonB family protein